MENTKYPRSMHFPFSPGTTSDDRISSDYSMFENRENVYTEKLDGQNDCISKLGVHARSHATFTEHPWDRAIWEIHTRIKNSLNSNEYIFGENMYAIHSLEYSKLTSPFYMFGVRVNDEWLSYDDMLEYAYILELPTAPLLFRGTTDDVKSKVLELVKQPSVLDAHDVVNGTEMMEGLVCRNSSSFKQDVFSDNLLKWVRKDHVNTDVHWTKNWKKANINY